MVVVGERGARGQRAVQLSSGWRQRITTTASCRVQGLAAGGESAWARLSSDGLCWQRCCVLFSLFFFFQKKVIFVSLCSVCGCFVWLLVLPQQVTVRGTVQSQEALEEEALSAAEVSVGVQARPRHVTQPRQLLEASNSPPSWSGVLRKAHKQKKTHTYSISTLAVRLRRRMQPPTLPTHFITPHQPTN